MTMKTKKTTIFAGIFLTIIFFGRISTAGGGTHTKSESKVESKLENTLREKYSSLKTLKADFTQTQKNPILKTSRESRGVLYIETPSKFRWETTTPEKSILLSTPTKTLYYTPPPTADGRGQVALRKANDANSQAALDLLSGGKKIAKNFKITTISPLKYLLKPRKRLGDLNDLELHLEKSTNLVYKIVLNFKSGKTTEIVLQNVMWNATLEPQVFTVEIPQNTDHIN